MVKIAINSKIIYNVYGDFMKFDLTRLNSGIDNKIDIDLEYKFDKDDLLGTDLIECDIVIKGEIYKNSMHDTIVDLSATGTMVLPCAITLKPTEHEYSININEKMEENGENCTNTLDIFPIIWENILMEIPMRVVSPGAENIELSGDGWKLIKDEEITSSPFAELADMFNDREVK